MSVVKTEVKVPYLRVLKLNFVDGLWQRANLILGHLNPLIKIPKIERAHEMLETIRTKHRLVRFGPLSDELVEEWTADNFDRVGETALRRVRHQAVNDELVANPPDDGLVQRGAALLSTLIQKNRSHIKSVATVGARVDPTLSYIAGKHEDLKCTSIDMQVNLAEINALLPQHPNWEFKPGYAYRTFRDGFSADVVYMTSTASKFNTMELRAYLEEWQKAAKFLIFNEPWWAFPFHWQSLRQIKPEDIDPQRSRVGGFVGDYQHNYAAILPEFDFEILRMELLPLPRSADGGLNHLQVVAVNRKLVTGDVYL